MYADQCSFFPLSLFRPLAYQLFKRLTWLEVTLGNVVFSFPLRRSLWGSPLCFTLGFVSETRAWKLSWSCGLLMRPNLSCKRGPGAHERILIFKTYKPASSGGAGEMPIVTPEVKREPLVPSFTQCHPVALSSPACRPCALHFNGFQSKFDEFATREEAGKCGGVALRWSSQTNLRDTRLVAPFDGRLLCEDFNMAATTAMLCPFLCRNLK